MEINKDDLWHKRIEVLLQYHKDGTIDYLTLISVLEVMAKPESKEQLELQKEIYKFVIDTI